MKKNILTGLRPTGTLHLGHYFGACQNYLKMQDEYSFFLEIADVQALTNGFTIYRNRSFQSKFLHSI